MAETLTGQKVLETIQTYPGGEIEIVALADLLQTSQERLSSHLRVLKLFGKIEMTDNVVKLVM